MNEYTSAIVVAIITGVFSVIAIIIQRKQEEKNLQLVTYEMIKLMIDCTMNVLINCANVQDPTVKDQYIQTANELKAKYKVIREKLDDLYTQNEVIRKLTDNSNQ